MALTLQDRQAIFDYLNGNLTDTPIHNWVAEITGVHLMGLIYDLMRMGETAPAIFLLKRDLGLHTVAVEDTELHEALLSEMIDVLIDDLESTQNKQRVIDWVNNEMRSIESSHDESLEDRVQQYDDALRAYKERSDAAALIALLEEDQLDAQSRLTVPTEAYAAEFGRVSAQIQQESIEREIQTITSLLEFLRA